MSFLRSSSVPERYTFPILIHGAMRKPYIAMNVYDYGAGVCAIGNDWHGLCKDIGQTVKRTQTGRVS